MQALFIALRKERQKIGGRKTGWFASFLCFTICVFFYSFTGYLLMKLAKNTLLNLMPSIAGTVVSILTVPLYISLVGPERYGALLIAWVLLGYFGQVDLGLGRALTQRLSAMPDGTPQDRAGLVWSASIGACVMSAMGAALVYLAASVFFGSFFEADSDLKAEAVASAWLFALCVPIIMFTGVSSGALTGLERFGVVSTCTSVGNLLSQLLPLLVSRFHSVELSWLLGASLTGRLAGLVPILVSMWLVFLRGHCMRPSFAQLQSLFSFGVWIMITSIVGPLMTMSDRVVIGTFIDSTAVVAYSVPMQIGQRTVMLPMSFVQALFPRLSAQTASQAKLLGKDATVLVGQIYTLLLIGLTCFLEPLLRLWLGDNLDPRSIMIGKISLFGFWFNALANVPYAHIQARGNSKFTAIVHLAELPIYFGFLYIFGILFGLYGIALAFTARCFIDFWIMFIKAEFNERSVWLDLVIYFLFASISFFISLKAGSWLFGLVTTSTLLAFFLPVCWLRMPQGIKYELMLIWQR
jgi:O-antigen/teichoic acid export membrane protein